MGAEHGLLMRAYRSTTSKDATAHGSAFVFGCAADTIAQEAAMEIEQSDYEQRFWNQTTELFDDLATDEVVVACFEGAWQRKRLLSCQSK